MCHCSKGLDARQGEHLDGACATTPLTLQLLAQLGAEQRPQRFSSESLPSAPQRDSASLALVAQGESRGGGPGHVRCSLEREAARLLLPGQSPPSPVTPPAVLQPGSRWSCPLSSTPNLQQLRDGIAGGKLELRTRLVDRWYEAAEGSPGARLRAGGRGEEKTRCGSILPCSGGRRSKPG